MFLVVSEGAVQRFDDDGRVENERPLLWPALLERIRGYLRRSGYRQ